ncbi:carbamoyltransferase N-terminal domain-containing protein [Streptomyces sp. URMC 123]|uniref:carbamoyltransferase N-terminal domain-containing protein n=1 Tax=Streptomyces sp. URMC 123 TaxID=3423403 RepID=UPI003F1E36D0
MWCLLYGHDSSAALVIDGKLVAAVEEERLNREKKTSRFPVIAIRWCLESAGISFDDVDTFAFSWQFSQDVGNWMIAEITEDPAATVEQKFARLERLAETHAAMFGEAATEADFLEHTGHRLNPRKLVRVPHHIAHLMTGYHLSGGGDAAFLVSDGRAEWLSSIMGEVRGGEVKIFDDMTIDSRHSLAMLFSVVTRYLGFVPNNDEYKVMGLAGYGTPPEPNPFLTHVVEMCPDGTYKIPYPANAVPAYYELFDRVFDGDPEGREDFDYRVRVASAAQHMLETVTAGQIRTLEARSDLSRVIFEGGLALNCVNNSKLLQRSRFTEMDVSFGASDVGVAIGAALFASRQVGTPPRISATPYLGPGYDGQEIPAALQSYADQVVWRELDPADVPWEAAVFELGKKTTSPYMTFVVPVRPEYREMIQGACHVDGTSRIQTVTEQGNPLLAELLRHFTELTGIPCLINTSFNVAGEPIVCSPADALSCYFKTEMDHLFLGNFLVSRK